MAHAYAARRNTTPWDALLDEVNAVSAQVAFCDDQITRSVREAVDHGEVDNEDDALRPGGRAWDWVQMRRDRGELLVRTSKMAIDAGVAEQLVARVELQGRLMLEAAQAAAAELSLEPEQRLALVASIARHVVTLERRQNGMELTGGYIEGEMG